MSHLGWLLALLVVARPAHGELFTKYSLMDGYVRSCHQSLENFGSEEHFEVRRYEPEDGSHEGTLYPYDQDPLSGWCGEDQAGDRVSFLQFEMDDWSAEAIGSASLRLTPWSFPPDSQVEIRGPCDTDWAENSLTWATAPFVGATDESVLCQWSGDETVMAYDKPLSCNITQLAQASAGGALCLSVEMVRSPRAASEPVRFWARELSELDRRTTKYVADENMGNHVPGERMQTALEYGTVAGAEDTWRPHLHIHGSDCGVFPTHINSC